MQRLIRNISIKTTLLVCTLLALFATAVLAQNTYGGVKRIVPEEEIKRQHEFVEAEKYRLLKKYDQAIESYKKFLYDNPQNDAAWYGMSRCYFAQESLAQALEADLKALDISPDNQWYAILQADILEKSNRLKDAAKVYEGLLKKMPQTTEFYSKVAYLYVRAEDPKSALKTLDKLEAITGVTEETADKKHVIYVAMGEDKKAALELEKLVKANPDNLEYRKHLAQYYETMGNQTEARRVYEEILRINPEDPDAKIAARKPAPKGSSDAANLQALKPLFADPKVSIDAKIKELTPYLAKLQTNGDQALCSDLAALCSVLEQTHPDDAKTWSVSGDVLYLGDRLEEALARYQHCLKISQRVYSVWDNTMTILDIQKKYDELLSTAGQAMDAFPNQPKAYYFYARAASEKGLYQDAVNQVDQALLMTGNNTALKLDLLDLAGVALLKKKDLDGAAKRLEQALEKGGMQHPGVLEHYGDLQLQKGDKSKALEYWQKAYAIRKSPSLEQKIKG